MEQLGRRRLGLAGPEALHLAHLLTELFRECHVYLAAVLLRQPSGGCGKRREVTQNYHGRAAVHLHWLVFAFAGLRAGWTAGSHGAGCRGKRRPATMIRSGRSSLAAPFLRQAAGHPRLQPRGGPRRSQVPPGCAGAARHRTC